MRKKTLMNLKKKHQEGPAATPAPPGTKDWIQSNLAVLKPVGYAFLQQNKKKIQLNRVFKG